MASTLISMVPNGGQRQSRSHSLSATDPPSPESGSSDSHSSSDPDTHLSTISPWLRIPTASGLKGFSMEVDEFPGHSIMEHSELTFENRAIEMHAVDPYSNVEEIMLNNTPSSTKQDILMLEELIRDGVYDAASTPAPYSSYLPASIPLQASASPSVFAESCPRPFVPTQSYVEPPPPSHSTLSSIPLNATLPTSDEPKHTLNQSDYITVDSSDAAALPSNAWVGDPATLKTEVQSTGELSFDHIPSAVVSSKVVYPPKEACVDLPIVFPSIPLAGTKSRVETQIKLVFYLATPVSSSSQFPSTLHSRSPSDSDGSSLTASPLVVAQNLPDSEPSQLVPTHDRVGTYSYLRLPYGTTTKRRSTAAGGRRDSDSSDLENTLQVTADVVCSSAPTTAIQSCQSCQAREAKRTARKLAARVRPPPNTRKSKVKANRKTKKGYDEEFDELPQIEEGVEEEPNVDASILQFNCGDLLRFSSGGVTLPMRITCYCRHHKEKIGFQIVFTLTDYQGRVVGRGTTPPILITDDHKSNNAVSKLPPMHPLRQILHPTPPAHTVSLPVSIIETQYPVSSPIPEETMRPLTRRREPTEASQRRKRSRPYDGRPSRTSRISPGIEGRQGVVLALHPAHTRMQESRSQSGSAPATRSSTPISETRFILPSQSIKGLRNTDSQSPKANLSFKSEMCSPSPTQSLVSPSSTTVAEEQSILLSQLDLQYSRPLSSAAPIYPAMPFLTEMPKIHRLIPSSGPTTGGIEITVLGSNFHPSMSLECVFGGAVASSTHRWSDNTLVCVLPPRATPGLVAVGFKGIKHEDGHDEPPPACLFNYVDECDRQLMELALQVVGLKMTGKIEEARNVAMRIVGNTQSPHMTTGEATQMNALPDGPLLHHQLLGSLSGVDLETLTIKLLTLMDVPVNVSHSTPSHIYPINHKNATGQTLLHLAVFLALPSLVSCLIGRSIDLDAQNSNGLTALHFAAMAGWKEGVELLVNGGARTNIMDEMGLTPADRARDAGFASLTEMLDENGSIVNDRSGDEGDDERWQNDGELEDAVSDASSSEYSPAYHTRPRIASSTQVHEESSEAESPTELAPVSTVKSDVPLASQDTQKHLLPANDKHDASFVERLQRTLPQGIFPNMQIPGFLQLQLPEKAWGALPNIPVFPVLVPLPNLPNWPWNDSSNGSKKEKQQQQQPSFATLWTAYDSIANNAWRAQWEKWTAHVTALQSANDNRDSAELPPYTPREDSQSTQLETTPSEETAVPPVSMENRPSQNSTRSPLAKVKRRVGYGPVAIPETEVEAYHYKPAKRQKLKSKQDHMLVLFWIPILCVSFAYALYTTLPLALQVTQRLLPTLSQRI